MQFLDQKIKSHTVCPLDEALRKNMAACIDAKTVVETKGAEAIRTIKEKINKVRKQHGLHA